MNYYQKAIEKNQVIEFFRGEGEYFDLDKDRATHNNAFTYMQIIDFGTILGEDELYKQLEKDLSYYISLSNFNVYDLKIVFGIIWFYLVYRNDEKTLNKEWIIPKEILDTIRQIILKFNKSDPEFSKVQNVIDLLANKFDFHIGLTN